MQSYKKNRQIEHIFLIFFDKGLFFPSNLPNVNNNMPIYLKYFLANSAGISMGVSKPGL